MKKILLVLVAVIVTLLAYSQPVARQKVVFEIATGTWCGFCPGAAMGASDLIANGHDVAIIKYHVGDAFQNTYSVARKNYYGISGYPTTKIDGILTHVGGHQSQSIYPTYLNFYEQRINVPSPFTVSIFGENTSGLNYDAQLVITKEDTYTASNLVLHFAVTETNIPYAWFNQTHVKDVLRIMVPDQLGTPLDFTSQDEIIVDLSFTLNASWVTENMSVVAFVQDVPTKQIFQANIVEITNLQPASITSSFIASSTEICEGEEVAFTDQSSGNITSWLWTFEGGDPASSTEENPVVVYHTAGVYDVTLEVSNASQSSTTTMQDFISVLEMPGTPGTPSGDIIIDLYYVTSSEYTIEEVTGAIEYLWQLTPALAGSIEGTGITGTVTWNPIFTGQAFVSVKAIGDFCETEFSEALEITVTNTVGIDDQPAEKQLSISPNPSNGIFMLELPLIARGEAMNIKVYSINGKVMWEHRFIQGDLRNLTLNLKHLSQGIYYLVIRSESVNISRSISIIR